MSIETLTGGTLVSGITFTLTAQVLWSNGVQFDIFHDFKRQTMLNFLMFLASLSGIIAYPCNASKSSVWTSNITTLLLFLLVQYGLVMINHNSLARLNTYTQTFKRSTLNFVCGVFYFLPLLALIPVYLAANDKIPKGMLLNTSPFNTAIFKPMTLALIITTEVIATISDIGLLSNVFSIKSQLMSGSTTDKKRENIESVSLDLIVNYIITWFFLCADIMVKILIIYKFPLLFDSIITCCTIALRARSNILFGLNLKDIFETSRSYATTKSDDLKSDSLIIDPRKDSLILRPTVSRNAIKRFTVVVDM